MKETLQKFSDSVNNSRSLNTTQGYVLLFLYNESVHIYLSLCEAVCVCASTHHFLRISRVQCKDPRSNLLSLPLSLLSFHLPVVIGKTPATYRPKNRSLTERETQNKEYKGEKNKQQATYSTDSFFGQL